MLWQYMSFISQMWFYSFPVSSNHFSFYCPFRLQMMQKWLLSCQMPHCLSNITRKVTSKGGLSAFILSAFFFLQNKNFFKACNLQIPVVCIPCVFPALVGTGVWYLQSLSCICLPNDDYSSLTCVCPIPFLSTYRCTPTQLL